MGFEGLSPRGDIGILWPGFVDSPRGVESLGIPYPPVRPPPTRNDI